MFTIKPLESSPLKASTLALNAREFFKELHQTEDTVNFPRFMKKIKSMYTQGLDFVEIFTSEKQRSINAQAIKTLKSDLILGFKSSV